MPKVIFSERADEAIEIFIHQYVDSFMRLYTDTGVWSTRDILENYILGAEGIYREIRSAIIEKLSLEKVLGRKPSEKMSELSFHVGSRLIIVFFSDNKDTDERWIESIFINRKPIIF